jgi:hypothetical protein
MYKTIGIIIILSLLVFSAGSVLAKTEKGSSMADLIQMLQEQIEKLKAQIEALIIQIENWKDSRGDIRETEEEAKELLKILKELKRGMKGDDVQLLQEFLATDPQIYPEGYTTGYFGPLTEKAVKNFQELAGIEDEDGVVGSKTLSKINELLEEGAGSSGKVPPGLLIAPGIRKKIGYEPEVPEGQKLPPGIQKKLDGGDGNGEEDNEAPLISDISVLGTTSSSTTVIWKTDEESDSTVWYDIISPLSQNPEIESSSDMVLDHEIDLFQLTPDTDYYYKVGSSDILGNATSSSEMSFTTPSE